MGSGLLGYSETSGNMDFFKNQLLVCSSIYVIVGFYGVGRLGNGSWLLGYFEIFSRINYLFVQVYAIVGFLF